MLRRFRTLGRLALVAALPLLASVLPGAAQSRYGGGDQPGEFAFYVLSLSWSPSYCEAEGDRKHDIQCERPFNFVVHGLWPQHERGYPSDCNVDGERVPQRVLDANTDIFPSKGLMVHEWRKHGSCSGLSAEGYFKAARQAFVTVKVPSLLANAGQPMMVDPDKVEAEFRAANPGLAADAIAVTCDNRRLREVRVCFSKDMKGFTSCPEVDRASCRANRTYLPAVRGH